MATFAPLNSADDFPRPLLVTTSSYSLVTVSTSSTVPGPGAISGKFLKAVGEKTLDLVVSVIVRRRLASIQRTLSKAPYIFTNPLGAAQMQMMDQIYEDLRELCSEDQKEYYPRSVQRMAASLIQNITIITRRTTISGKHSSPTNERWEILLAEVEHRCDCDKLIHATVSINIRAGLLDHLARRSRRESTVVLLGIEGVGKSAISKQFKQDWDPQKLRSFRNVIIKSTITSMQAILLDLDTSYIEAAVDKDPHDHGLADVMAARKLIISPSVIGSDFTPMQLVLIGHAIDILWRNSAVRRAFRHATLKSGARNEAALESADHLFNSAGRIFSPSYKPTRVDILWPRVPTMGLHEQFIKIGNSTLRLADTSETHMKFLTHFLGPGDTTIAVFVVAVTDYNKYNKGENALQQSYESFRSLLMCPLFKTIILLFNKVDAFAELLENVPMEDYLGDYNGNTFSDACHFLETKFVSLSEDPRKKIITKFVSAFDTEAMADTLRIIQDEVNRKHPRDISSDDI